MRDPECRGCAGIPTVTALIEHLDASESLLEVRVSNAPARSLYERLGFQVIGTRKEYYDDPVEDALVMRRSRAAGR